MVVREARSLARMEAATCLWGDADLRWTVVSCSAREFTPSPTYGVIFVQPLVALGSLTPALAPVRACLQGCAIALQNGQPIPEEIRGVPYVCPPGRLQSPPLSWTQDGVPPLRSLHREPFQKFAQRA